MEAWIRLGLIVTGCVGGMVLIERSALYEPPKRGIQAVIGVAIAAVILRFVGVV